MKHCLSVLLSTLAAFSCTAHASLVGSSGTIPDLRVEGSYAFISVAQPFPGSICGGSRVYVDLATPWGRAAYATAMLAFSTQRPVSLRADDTSALIFGACAIYDIYLPQ